jgi:lysine 2,3-aminomutase
VSIEQRPERWKRVPAALWRDWQWQLDHRVSGCDLMALAQETLPASAPNGDAEPLLADVLHRFPASVTPYYAALSVHTHTALAAQWVPVAGELLPGGCEDPFADTAMPVPGVVHRFADRLLVAVTRDCAVRCRHCTRKNTLPQLVCFDPATHAAALMEYLDAHSEVREILVSGGDPLMLSDGRLKAVLDVVTSHPQIECVRIGSRAPVVLPMRITPALLATLGAYRNLWICTHFNHVDELTSEAVQACSALIEVGIPMANQSVLLKGVNDSIEAMATLCRALQRHRIKPYYVFECDPVAGTGHLRVDAATACTIERALRARLGGLALPRFVRDVAGATSKLDLCGATSAKDTLAC